MTLNVTDICLQMDKLASERLSIESLWQKIAIFAFPDHQDFFGTDDRLNMQVSYAALNATKRFDDTAVQAVQRLSSVMESLATPSNEKWHGLENKDPFAAEPTDEEKVWQDKTRDYMFNVRYSARSGFMDSNQRAIRSMIALGTGVVFMRENTGKDEVSTPVFYQWIPLNEVFLATNEQHVVDTVFRRFSMTARQMVQQFGEDKVCDAVKAVYNSNDKDTKRYNVVHAVMPRSEEDQKDNIVQDAPFASYYVDKDNQFLIGESGFYEFPYLIYQWQGTGRYPYSESPVMLGFSDIKGINSLRYAYLKGAAQFYDPALGAADNDGLDDLNMTPGEINYGWLDANTGRPKAVPIITQGNPQAGAQLLMDERNNINQTLFMDMFQYLAQNPDMTATQAMIVAQQKAQLLGPAGGKIQATMSYEVERMMGILARKGAFAPGAALEVPQSLQGRNVGARFSAPVDRLRMATEALAAERLIARATQLAQVDPDALMEIDIREILHFTAKADGAPEKFFRSQEAVAALKAAAAQQQQAAQGMQMLQQGAGAGKDVMGALAQAAAMSQNNGQPPANGGK